MTVGIQPRTITVPKRLLLGPGPSELDPEVARALSLPSLGHLDPAMVEIMQDIKRLLQYTFVTRNEATLAVSGTGTSAMETALANVIEPGDKVLVGIMGYFGDRLAQIAAKLGGQVIRVEAEWGKAIDPDTMIARIKEVTPQVVCLVHAETSTGVVQPEIEHISSAAHEVGAVLVVDTVTSLGGQPVKVDDWGIDVCYSAGQKCIGAPSGLSPITFGELALDKINKRTTPVSSFYLDLNLLRNYWDSQQYHHTISAPLVYALHTALDKIQQEGLENRWKRHEINQRAFLAGVESLSLDPLAEKDHRLNTLITIKTTEDIAERTIRQELLNDYSIEVGGGIGPFQGKLLRIGLMGYGSRREFIIQLLAALESILRKHGRPVPEGCSVAAAMKVYETAL